MAQIVSVMVRVEDRELLAAVLNDRNRPLKHVQRARIVLLSADRLLVQEIARRTGVSRPSVWRWQRHFAEHGVDVLLREPSRKPGKAPLSDTTVNEVVALTCTEPPGEATHWRTGRAMAKTVGISLRAVQRIWETHRLQPHRSRSPRTLSIHGQCRLPGLARSGVYRPRPANDEGDWALMRRIDALFMTWPFLTAR